MAGKEEGQRSEVSSTSSSALRGDGSSVCLAPPSWDRLIPLRSRDDIRRFLRAILSSFVDTVDLEKPGLVEDLIKVRVLTARDAESLATEHLYPTTSEKARHLWSILFRINFKVFVEKALPILVQHYWYIIPERFWLPGDAPPSQHTLGEGSSHSSGDRSPCLRCAIQMRIRPTDMADLLMAAGLISPKTHMEVIQGYRKSSTDWAKLFAALKHPKCRDMPSLVIKLQRMVTRHSLPVPDDFPHLLTQGFPCSCPVSKNKTGHCFPCASNLSSSDSSLPSLHSLPVSSVSEDCQYVSSVSEDCQSTSLLSLLSASTDDGVTISNHWSEYSETTLKQVVSVSTQDIPGEEVRSHFRQDEEETKLKSFLVEADNREMNETSPKLVAWREPMLGLTLPIQSGQQPTLHIVKESKIGQKRNRDLQTSTLEMESQTETLSVSFCLFQNESDNPEILSKESVKSEQAETVINIDKDAEKRHTHKFCTETELPESKHQSFETLMYSHVSIGLCARLTSRLCGHHTKCGICLSDTGKCLKKTLMMLRNFFLILATLFLGLCGVLFMLGLFVLPYVLIVLGVESGDYDCFLAALYLFVMQFFMIVVNNGRWNRDK